MTLQKINDWTTYVLIVLLWTPHGIKECVEFCTGPNFISPTGIAFMTPFVQMDISFHGFLMQLLWAPLFIGVMWMLFRLRDSHRYGKFFQLYAVRWIIFSIILIVLYNLLFWGGLRPFIFPSFIF